MQVGDLVYALPSSNEAYGITRRSSSFMGVVVGFDSNRIKVLPVFSTALTCVAKYLQNPNKYTAETRVLVEESKAVLRHVLQKQPINGKDFRKVFLHTTLFNLSTTHFKTLDSVSSITIRKTLMAIHADYFSRPSSSQMTANNSQARLEAIEHFCKEVEMIEATMFDSITSPHLTL